MPTTIGPLPRDPRRMKPSEANYSSVGSLALIARTEQPRVLTAVLDLREALLLGCRRTQRRLEHERRPVHPATGSALINLGQTIASCDSENERE